MRGKKSEQLARVKPRQSIQSAARPQMRERAPGVLCVPNERREQAKRELSLAQRRLLAEIHSLYAEAETALNELEGLARSAQLAEESQKLITLRYRNGESTVLEVVDAQNTLTLSRNAYDDGQARFRVAVANLQTLTGTF